MGCCASKEESYKVSMDVDKLKELQKKVEDLQQKLQEANEKNKRLEGAAAAGKPSTSGSKAEVEVLWFPEPKLPCKFYLNGETCKKNERGTCTQWAHEETNLVKMIRTLTSAKRTLDVCVFNITCDQLSNALVDLHKRGVKIRIITDNDQAESQGSDIQAFRDAGIPVRTDKTNFHMHHKFAVVDGETLLNGSFNWSRQAVLGNEENVVITRNKALAQTFSTQFEALWAKFA